MEALQIWPIGLAIFLPKISGADPCTGSNSDGNNPELTGWITTNVDLTPKGIINRFDLFRPIYSSTTNYGHFGKDNLPWEELNLFKD